MPRALVALLLAAATGMALSTIGRGLKELGEEEAPGRVRRPGAGRKPAIAKDPTLMSDLEALVEPTTRGDPDRWTCKTASPSQAGLRLPARLEDTARAVMSI